MLYNCIIMIIVMPQKRLKLTKMLYFYIIHTANVNFVPDKKNLTLKINVE